MNQNREIQINTFIAKPPTIRRYFAKMKKEFKLANMLTDEQLLQPIFTTDKDKKVILKINCLKCENKEFQRSNTSSRVWYCSTELCPNSKLSEADKEYIETKTEPFATTEFFKKIAEKRGAEVVEVEYLDDDEDDNIDEDDDLTPEESKDIIKDLRKRVKELEAKIKMLEEDAKKVLIIPEEEPEVAEEPVVAEEPQVVVEIPNEAELLNMSRADIKDLMFQVFSDIEINAVKMKSRISQRASKVDLVVALRKKRDDPNYKLEKF